MQNSQSNPTVHRTAMSLVAAVVATVAILLLISASAVAERRNRRRRPSTTSGKAGKAKLLDNGKAIPPENAPKRVVRAIKAANHIRKTKYVWGGGHGDFESKGYDCSGAVSYMLHGAGCSRPL